jgi:hypothetical protein
VGASATVPLPDARRAPRAADERHHLSVPIIELSACVVCDNGLLVMGKRIDTGSVFAECEECMTGYWQPDMQEPFGSRTSNGSRNTRRWRRCSRRAGRFPRSATSAVPSLVSGLRSARGHEQRGTGQSTAERRLGGARAVRELPPCRERNLLRSTCNDGRERRSGATSCGPVHPAGR